MAGQHIELMDVRELLRLKLNGYSHRQIARQLGINRNTVNTYIRWADRCGHSYRQLMQLADVELGNLLAPRDYKDQSRYQQLAGYFSYIEAELTKPGATLQAQEPIPLFLILSCKVYT